MQDSGWTGCRTAKIGQGNLIEESGIDDYRVWHY